MGICCPPPEASPKSFFPLRLTNHSSGTGFVGVRYTLDLPSSASSYSSWVMGIPHCHPYSTHLSMVLELWSVYFSCVFLLSPVSYPIIITFCFQIFFWNYRLLFDYYLISFLSLLFLIFGILKLSISCLSTLRRNTFLSIPPAYPVRFPFLPITR